MNMNMWVAGSLNQLFIRGFSTETNFSKIKVVIGKTRFFVMGPFSIPNLFVLTLTSDNTFCMEIVRFCMEIVRFCMEIVRFQS